MIGTLAAFVGIVGVGWVATGPLVYGNFIGELIPMNCSSASRPKHSKSCDSIFQGYQCEPEISHYWGQYSPFYSVPSEISADIPRGCSVTFAQVLSRHGARDPTVSLLSWTHRLETAYLIWQSRNPRPSYTKPWSSSSNPTSKLSPATMPSSPTMSTR